MRRNPSYSDSKTYELKIVMFEHVQPEELLALMHNCRRVVDGIGNTLVAVNINYLRTLLRGESLQEFDELASQNIGTSNALLKFVLEGLLGWFFPIDALSKQNHVMRRTMCKPR